MVKKIDVTKRLQVKRTTFLTKVFGRGVKWPLNPPLRSLLLWQACKSAKCSLSAVATPSLRSTAIFRIFYRHNFSRRFTRGLPPTKRFTITSLRWRTSAFVFAINWYGTQLWWGRFWEWMKVVLFPPPKRALPLTKELDNPAVTKIFRGTQCNVYSPFHLNATEMFLVFLATVALVDKPSLRPCWSRAAGLG